MHPDAGGWKALADALLTRLNTMVKEDRNYRFETAVCEQLLRDAQHRIAKSK
jgi:hypothetical protein